MARISSLLAFTVALMLPGPSVAQSLDILLNCSNCHRLGSDDTGAPPLYPVLEGQPTRYIARQLQAYRSGLRSHPQMELSAEALGPGGDAAMARMFGYAPTPDLILPPDADQPEGATEIVKNGDWERGIAPCETCHTLNRVDGIDMSARDAPRLHGQPRAYLARQLRAYADGSRASGPMGRMQAFAAALDAGEIEALAAYYAAWRERSSQ